MKDTANQKYDQYFFLMDVQNFNSFYSSLFEILK